MRLLLTTSIAAIAILLAQTQSVHAATITVNTTADELNNDGDCSLREAIEAANTNAPVDACPAGQPAPTVDAITFSVTGTITLTSGQLMAIGNVTIDGPGATSLTISGNNESRVLEVIPGVTLNLDGVTITDGSAEEGGGIYNSGTLSITNSTFSGNSATFAGTAFGSAGGGGIRNDGTLTVTNSTFSGNSTASPERDGGAINNALVCTDSGCRDSALTVTIINSTFSQNSAGSGGGVGNRGGTVTVTDSTFSQNSAPDGAGIFTFGTLTVNSSSFSRNSAARVGGAAGGGILHFGGTLTVTDSAFIGNSSSLSGGGIDHRTGTLTMSNSTVSGNSADTSGGGIAIFGSFFAETTVTLTNTTVSGNSAGNQGGGLWNNGLGTLTATHSTFSGNSSSNGGAIHIQPSAGSFTLKNTIVANSPFGGNCAGAITDGGGNLQYPGTGCGATIPSTDPMLDPAGLQNNGGPTATIALQPGSPAIDTAVLANCLPTDQRGVARPQGAGCDIGAFELAAAKYDFAGFFSPVENPPALNPVRAGSAVPVKFSLAGDQGLDIFATGYPKSQEIDCDNSAPAGEPATEKSSSLSYDPVAHRYAYVWKTAKASSNTCRQLIVRLNDNTDHLANFSFK